MVVTIIVFLLILSVLVLIHEAGHYFVAKKFGIKVEEFGFGFPLTPALWQRKIGETVYSFYPVLIGGFVKLYGEDDAGAGRVVAKKKETPTHDPDEKRAFYAKPIGQRILVVFAGVCMNAILAVVIYYVFLAIGNFQTTLPLIGNHKFFDVDQKVTTQVDISEVEKNSPAQAAGISPFSTIQSLNGQPVTQLDTFASIIKASAGKPLMITWQDENQKIHSATVIPRINPPKGQGALGVAFYPIDSVTLSYDTFSQRLFSGFIHPANLMVYNFAALGYLIDISIKEKNVAPVSEGVSGPIGIGYVVGSIIQIPNVQQRIMQLLNLVGLLSISLAFFNVLPIPGLDGGRLFFLIIEAITHKKVDPKIEGYIHAVGMAFLLLILFLVTIKDINQFIIH